ncbi:carboxypeptidase regulatory-like domain-containing protein [Microbacterium sp. BWT-B31]|uniref:carboxypeptidase regulatory-like domain-containing protein n=1 Tax=Microbacterium sp. BWT-B31 TaxID=3232072 RepID=UPI0035292200
MSSVVGSFARRSVAALVAFTVAIGVGWAAPASAAPAPAEGSISGTVTDAATGAPLEGVRVTVIDDAGAESAAVTTGSTGGYTATGLAPGAFRVLFSADAGYDPSYWPGRSGIAAAEAVTLAAGESQVGIDAALTATDGAGAPPTAPAAAETGGDPSGVAATAAAGDDSRAVADAPGDEDSPTSASSRAGAAVGTRSAIAAEAEELDSGSITGTVTVERTGAPLAGVSVSASGAGYAMATTAADGTYALSGLAPGEYRVYFSAQPASGLVNEYWPNTHDYFAATAVTVAAGASIPGIDASLVASASIAGQVDNYQASIENGLTVTAYSINDAGGRLWAAQATADDADGSYVLTGLAPGEYVLEADPWGAVNPAAAQYYPGAPTLDQAERIVVADGDALTGYDFTLHTGVRVNGTLSFNGSTPSSAFATAYRWSGDSWEVVRRITAQGDYSFSEWFTPGKTSLPAGTYTVGFEAAGYCSQYWNDKATLAGADSFTPEVGMSQDAVDATLRPGCDGSVTPVPTPSVASGAVDGELRLWVEGAGELDGWFVRVVGGDGEGAATVVDDIPLTLARQEIPVTQPGLYAVAAHHPATGLSVSAGDHVVVAAPIISGDTAAGSVLTASAGVVNTDLVTLAYHWAVAGTPVPGATGQTFVPGATEVGKTVTVTVTGSTPGLPSRSATSTPFGPITAAELLPLAVGSPQITGTPQVGEQLTVHPGTWGPAPVTLTYQWLVGDEPVPGAEGATFTPDADAVGKTVRAVVLGAKPGYDSASVASPQIGPIAPGDLITAVPTISGTPRVGDPLRADAGEWGPDSVELSYQWLVDGEPVGGATGETFTPDVDHLSKPITVVVTGTKPGYAQAVETSAATSRVAAGNLSVSDPRIVGKARVGVEAIVDASGWGPRPVALVYQWLADGLPIKDAVADRFTPDASLVGAVLSVSVSATKPGFDSVERTIVVGEVPPSVTVSASRAQRGEEIVVSGQYFLPGEAVLLELHSEPIELGTLVADDEGAFTTAVTIAQNAEIGAHDVVATGLESDLVGSAPLEVYDLAATSAVAGPSTGGGSGSLPVTGGGLPVVALSFGIVLIALGSVIAWRRRVLS